MHKNDKSYGSNPFLRNFSFEKNSSKDRSIIYKVSNSSKRNLSSSSKSKQENNSL